MWVKTLNEDYYRLENFNRLTLTEFDGVWYITPGSVAIKFSQHATEAEAQAALDEFMKHQGFAQVS